MLTALEGGQRDRRQPKVQGWMDYWNDKYMNGVEKFESDRLFDMDARFSCAARLGEPLVSAMYFIGDLVPGPNWKADYTITKDDAVSTVYRFTIETPEGTRTKTMERNDKMAWVTEYPIKEQEEVHWINVHAPATPRHKVDIRDL